MAGGSRYRWEGIAADVSQLEPLLRRFPDSDPDRPLRAAACFQIVMRGEVRPLTIEREHGEKRRMFRRRSFWKETMALVTGPTYVEYSYRERADVYRQPMDFSSQRKLREAASLLAYSTYEAWIRGTAVTAIDLFVRRE